VFNGWTGASLFSIRTARRRGIPSVLQTGSAQIVRQAEILRQEEARFGEGEGIAHPRVIARAVREYEEADRLVVPSRFVCQTFIDAGGLVLVSWAAVAVGEAPEDRPAKAGPATVLFLGACSLREDVPHLLQVAWMMGAKVEVRIDGGHVGRHSARPRQQARVLRADQRSELCAQVGAGAGAAALPRTPEAYCDKLTRLVYRPLLRSPERIVGARSARDSAR
jgi:hypothetical protein